MRMNAGAKTWADISLAALASVLLATYYGAAIPFTVARSAGLTLAIPSFILWATARLQLGKSFSVRPKARRLVTHGLYSKVRNPVYVFSTLWLIGFALAAGKPWWLLFLLVVVPMQTIRARREAKVLEAKFGDDYREYRRRTWF